MHRLYERHVTWGEAVELLFSGKYDNLTVREFKEKFPLKPDKEIVGVLSLRYRISRVIEREVAKYLENESEWKPYLQIAHNEDDVKIRFTFPDQSTLPSMEIELREVPNGN